MNEQAREGDLEATGSCLLVSIRVECRRAVLISRFPCLQQVGDRMPSHAAVQGQRVLIEPEKFTPHAQLIPGSGSDLGYTGDLLKTVPPGPPRARPAPPSPLNTY